MVHHEKRWILEWKKFKRRLLGSYQKATQSDVKFERITL